MQVVTSLASMTLLSSSTSSTSSQSSLERLPAALVNMLAMLILSGNKSRRKSLQLAGGGTAEDFAKGGKYPAVQGPSFKRPSFQVLGICPVCARSLARTEGLSAAIGLPGLNTLIKIDTFIHRSLKTDAGAVIVCLSVSGHSK